MDPRSYDTNGPNHPYCAYPGYYPPYYYGYPHPYDAGYNAPNSESPPHSQPEDNGTGGSDSNSARPNVSVPYVYYVRLVQDPKKRSRYVVRQWHGVGQDFQSLDEMKRLLQDAFPDELPALTSDFYVGYFEPPSGAKRWIIDDRDLQSLYAKRDPGSKINLWCEPKLPEENGDGSGASAQPAAKKKKGTTRESIEVETESVFEQLKEKHPDMENPKLRLWAKIIQSGHWEDYDNPPPIPLITGKTKPQPRNESIADALAGAATAIVKVLQPQEANTPKRISSATDRDKPKISPMKSATIRRSCLDDLKKLKDLHEDGVLTEEEFREEKQQILATLRSLK